MTFPKWRTVLFVNGCFWHQHPRCERSRLPKTNTDFWKKKLERNAQRDRINYEFLEKQGWRVLVMWECDIASSDVLEMLKIWFRTSTKRN